jgi:hypothetical protein
MIAAMASLPSLNVNTSNGSLANTLETALQKAGLSFATTTFILGSFTGELNSDNAEIGGGSFLTIRKMAMHLLQRSFIPSAPTFCSAKLKRVLHPGHTISITTLSLS